MTKLLKLDDVRNVKRIFMNAIGPCPLYRQLDRPVTLPNGAVTLKSTPKSNLPNPIPFLHPSLGFNVAQFIPQR